MANESEKDGRTVLVHSVKRVFDGFLKIDEAVVTHPTYDGGSQNVTRLSMERGDSVAALLIDRARGLTLLTEQFRYPTFGKGPGWIKEIPAGVPREGEEYEAAARREVFEETGYDDVALERVSTFYVSPGGSSERITLFLGFFDGIAQDLDRAQALRDSGEDIKLIETPLQEFMDAARRGDIDDAKTLIAGLWLVANSERLPL